jgi:hypothetical protein
VVAGVLGAVARFVVAGRRPSFMSDEIRFTVPTHPTSWKEIDGWFDFAHIYFEVASKCPPGAILVEVGSWKGRSAAFMCTEIRDQQKPVYFFCVDTWKGTSSGPDAPAHRAVVDSLGGDMFDTFHRNMEHWRGLYLPLRMTSRQASELFPNKGVDFVFLDANHTTEGVLEDIDCWKPKVIPGGVLAGNDYEWESVKKAVDDRFPDRKVSGNNWYVKV